MRLYIQINGQHLAISDEMSEAIHELSDSSHKLFKGEAGVKAPIADVKGFLLQMLATAILMPVHNDELSKVPSTLG